MQNIKTFTKDSLKEDLKKIRDMGWIKTARPGNDGGAGNTLEDLLGIPENNLPIPNASEWELKTTKSKGNSLITLFHLEPSPRALKFVPDILLKRYGWCHKEAGKKYPANEMSFRQTIRGDKYTDRGFKVYVNRIEEKIEVQFDINKVDQRHLTWKENIKTNKYETLNPCPYWGFTDIFCKAGTKLHNCFFVHAEKKKINNVEHYKYVKFTILKDLDKDMFINSIENGTLQIDFDSRTNHNHGTKFRVKENSIINLYKHSETF